jgi:Flp pilus assembly pilin Flp
MRRRLEEALRRAYLAGSVKDTGQSMVEYAIVTALIAIAALAALEGFGDSVKGAFDAIIDKLPK